jgi:hypothetical protein
MPNPPHLSFIIPFPNGKGSSPFKIGVALLLGFRAFLHGRCACGEGLFRLFGFIQNQEQPAGLPAQAVHSADQGQDQGKEYQEPQTQ